MEKLKDGGEAPARPLVLDNATAVTPFRVAKKTCVVIEDGLITRMGTSGSFPLPAKAEVADLRGRYLIPGFIDLHIHGVLGFDFTRDSSSGIEKALGYCLAHGTTHLLATVYLDEPDRLLEALRRLASAARERPCRGILHGIHLEGPFINKQMSGALDESHVQEADAGKMNKLIGAGGGFVKMMTIAPEVTGAHEVMQAAAREGIVLAIGHSAAKYEDIEIALDLGLSQVTHIFNAMAPMHHREPGVLTAAFLKKELKVHLIADGVHVHPAVVKLLYNLKGPSGIIMISDAVNVSGCEDGVYDVFGRTVRVSGGGAYLEDGTIAGSTVMLDRSLKYMVENTDIPLQEAVRMATLNPARVLGLDRKKGIIAAGKDADLVVLEEDFSVCMTIVDGRVAYAAGQ